MGGRNLRHDVGLRQRLGRLDLHEVVGVPSRLVRDRRGSRLYSAPRVLWNRRRVPEVLVVRVPRLARSARRRNWSARPSSATRHRPRRPWCSAARAFRPALGVRPDAHMAGSGAAAVGHVGEVHRELVLVVGVLVRVLERRLEDLPAVLGLHQREALVAGIGVGPLELEVDVLAVVDGLDRHVHVVARIVHTLDRAEDRRFEPGAQTGRRGRRRGQEPADSPVEAGGRQGLGSSSRSRGTTPPRGRRGRTLMRPGADMGTTTSWVWKMLQKRPKNHCSTTWSTM